MVFVVLLLSMVFFAADAHFVRVKKAVIPVGGMGTRYLPWTKMVGKEFLPIVDGKPMVHLIVEEAQAGGIEECLFITSNNKQSIIDYFTPDIQLNNWLLDKGKSHLLDGFDAVCRTMAITCVDSRTGLGEGYAVSCAKSYITEEFFAAMWPDNLIASKVACIKQLIDIAQELHATIIAVEQVPIDDMVAYGMVEVGEQVADNVWKITGLKQKPKRQEVTSNLAVIGRFVLSSKIFDSLAHIEKGVGGEYWLTDALQHMIDLGEPVYAYKIDGIFFDTGTPEKWAKAVKHYNEEI